MADQIPMVTNAPEPHTRVIDSDINKLPKVWQKEYIGKSSDISIGDIITIYTENMYGVAPYDIGEILKNLYMWCKTSNGESLSLAYEHMYHLYRYLYGDNARNLK